MEGVTRLQKARLVYVGRNSSTEGETRLCRERLVYGGGGSSAKGETSLPSMDGEA